MRLTAASTMLSFALLAQLGLRGRVADSGDQSGHGPQPFYTLASLQRRYKYETLQNVLDFHKNNNYIHII